MLQFKITQAFEQYSVKSAQTSKSVRESYLHQMCSTGHRCQQMKQYQARKESMTHIGPPVPV